MTQVLVVGDLVKVQMWSHDNEQAAVNTFHYKVVAAGGATLTDLLTAFETACVPSYLPLLNQNANYDGLFGQIVFPLPLMVGEKNNTSHGPGTGGLSGQARQVAGLISWGTPLAGPGGRGRTYIPFTSTQDSTGSGTVDPAYVTKMGTFATAVSTFVNIVVGGRTATVAFGIKKRNSSVFNAITTGSVSTKWATQMRRGSFGRPNTSPF